MSETNTHKGGPLSSCRTTKKLSQLHRSQQAGKQIRYALLQITLSLRHDTVGKKNQQWISVLGDTLFGYRQTALERTGHNEEQDEP